MCKEDKKKRVAGIDNPFFLKSINYLRFLFSTTGAAFISLVLVFS